MTTSLGTQVNESVYDPEPELQAEAAYDRFNESCALNKCYQMTDECSDKLSVDVKDEHERFCSRWCCALLVASGRLSLASAATSFRVYDLKRDAGDVPMVIVGESGVCTSLSDSAGDDWCTGTCKDSMETNPACPTLCECNEGNIEEQVDYDPIAQATEPTPIAEATTPPAAEAPTPPVAEAPTAPVAEAPVPMVIVGADDSCRSLTDSASDDWCTGTCKGSMETNPACPTLCECADGKIEPVDLDPITEAAAANEAAKQAVANAANVAAPASSAAMTGEAGRDHLQLEGLGGLADVEKACVQAFTGRGNPHAGHAPGVAL